MMGLPELDITPKSGREEFHVDGAPVGFDLLSFWRWYVSDIVSNVTRGIVAEYVVAQALGVACKVRAEWGKFDLKTRHGIRIEVKSSAYIQRWYQKEFSKPRFDVSSSRGWESSTGHMEDESRHQADVYVFTLLAHQDKETVDPLNLEQWEFYVLPRSTVAALGQKTMGIETLKKQTKAIPYAGLREAVERAA